MVETLVNVIGGYVIGLIAAFAVLRPMRAWTDGYNTAKDFFRDWERGFNTGFDAGWNAAFDKVKGALISNATTEELRRTKEEKR